MIDERIKSIANENGSFGVLAKAEEESLEVHDAIVEFLKDPSDPDLENHMAEEIADFMIVAEQLAFKFGLTDSIAEWREFKINRTMERLGLK